MCRDDPNGTPCPCVYYHVISGMDARHVRKYVNTLLIFICVILQTASSQPYPGRQIAGVRDRDRQVSTYTNARGFRRMIPYQRLLNSWNTRSYLLSRADVRQSQGRISERQFIQSLLPRIRTNQVSRPTSERLRTNSFRMYNRPELIAQDSGVRPSSDEMTKVSVVTGPLSKVLQHPRPRTTKGRHRLRYRVVPEAKSFPGILKDTSLDVTNL